MAFMNTRALTAFAMVFFLIPFQIGRAQIMFSVDPASPHIDGNLTPDDILAPGPSVVVQGTSLGLQDNFYGGLFDNLDALSYGCDPIQAPIYFSVDRVAVGLTDTAVYVNAQPGVASAAGDIYLSQLNRNNTLYKNEVDLGLTQGFFGDDLDALSLKPSGLIYFSIDSLSTQNGSGTANLANNIYLNTFGNIYASGVTDIGLNPVDDLDALILWDQYQPGILNPGIDKALFSLSKFSPSTFTSGSGFWSPADILYTDFTGNYSLWAWAASLGLRADDELDALATPEPSQLGFCTVIMVLCWALRRWKYTYKKQVDSGIVRNAAGRTSA